MRTLEHREVLSFLRGVLHALHVVQQRAAPAVHSGHVCDLEIHCPRLRVTAATSSEHQGLCNTQGGHVQQLIE
jgi:hypothetical protein